MSEPTAAPEARVPRAALLRALAVAGIVLTTAIWGCAFVFMKVTVERVPPTYLIAIRFTLAAFCAFALALARGSRPRAVEMRAGAALGFWLAASYISQTYGLARTTASNNAFITTFYVAIAPLLSMALYKTKLRRMHLVAAAVALAGIAMISLRFGEGSAVGGGVGGGVAGEGFSIGAGDALTLLCSLFYAIHIVVLQQSVRRRDVFTLNATQFLFCALFCWVAAPLLEGGAILAVRVDASLVGSFLYLSVLSTFFCFTLQLFGQKHLSVATASVLLALECVFGALFGAILLHDPVTAQTLCGFATMFAAVLLSVRADSAPVGDGGIDKAGQS